MKIKKDRLLITTVFFAVVLLIIFYAARTPKQFVSNQTIAEYSDIFFSYKIAKYPSGVNVTSEKINPTIGFVTDPWNLNFGIIPTGGYGERHLNISNPGKSKVRVNFNVYGSIKPMISFSKNNFILEPNESVYVDIVLNTTVVNEPGYYTGEIDVIIKKPNFSFLYFLL